MVTVSAPKAGDVKASSAEIGTGRDHEFKSIFKTRRTGVKIGSPLITRIPETISAFRSTATTLRRGARPLARRHHGSCQPIVRPAGGSQHGPSDPDSPKGYDEGEDAEKNVTVFLEFAGGGE